MKQEKKRALSKEKILNAAIIEFGTKTYDNASLNNICNDNNISKGLVYHYFKNKDSLYLNCVENCFTTFTAHIMQGLNNVDTEDLLSSHLSLRQQFFEQNQHLATIFFNTILHPPKHLEKEIKELKKPFDAISFNSYKDFISTIKLRDNIAPEEAVEFFCMFQEMFNSYFADKYHNESDYSFVAKDHELKLPKLLDIILNGIIKENNK